MLVQIVAPVVDSVTQSTPVDPPPSDAVPEVVDVPASDELELPVPMFMPTQPAMAKQANVKPRAMRMLMGPNCGKTASGANFLQRKRSRSESDRTCRRPTIRAFFAWARSDRVSPRWRTPKAII